MTLWWALVTLCCALNCATSAPFVPRHKYKNSFRLAAFTRAHVQQLLQNYKEQQMGNVHFEDRSRRLRDLPLLSTDFYMWLSLLSLWDGFVSCVQDWDRLLGAFRDMQVYWSMLERRRRQLEEEQREQVEAQPAQTRLIQSIGHIQWNLRDLIGQVSSQVRTALHTGPRRLYGEMRGMRSSWTQPTAAAMHANPQRSARTVWDSRVEGYIILRDLDLYLTKLARDFLLLASKTRA
ncbi:uncharacterized protein LOC119420290 [Nematolebias whitei]|uniref:uncharacterized protein LOC119420290 n=1 Tax=Nematolebias whitei TaxID=451745 RepID=UPI00189AF67C|nr:uncharacterized protein LOC119420290 [Nematolebias whitei]